MNKRIIYKNENGGVSVIIPCDCGLTVEQIAKKDVPTGVAYKVVNASEVPSDRDFRDLWDVDEASLTDGVGS